MCFKMERVNKFFQHFVEEHLATPEDEKLPPFRLIENSIGKNEVSGYSLEWSSQYLNVHKCPVLLSNVICAEVVLRTNSKDLSFLVREGVQVDADTDEKLLNNKTIYLDARKVIEVVFRTVDELVRTWYKELPEKVVTLLGYCKHVVSLHAIKNTRRKMEDRHLIVPLLQTFTDREDLRDVGLYAVFDGHGGVEAASYAAAQFLFNLISTTSTTPDLSSAISQSLIETDNHFSLKAKKDNLRSGSTAVVAVVTESSIHISWLGDSQAVVVRSGQAISVMDPHKPERADEKARIEALGGRVMWYGTWRVNGNLAVSRAIGDVDHRPYVSGVPDSEIHERVAEDEYLVVACDGLWDLITPEKLVTLVFEYLQAGNDRAAVSEMLVREAKSKGSGDNITCVVVFFLEDIGAPVPVEPTGQENNLGDGIDGNCDDTTESRRAKDPSAHSIFEPELPDTSSGPTDTPPANPHVTDTYVMKVRANERVKHPNLYFDADGRNDTPITNTISPFSPLPSGYTVPSSVTDKNLLYLNSLLARFSFMKFMEDEEFGLHQTDKINRGTKMSPKKLLLALWDVDELNTLWRFSQMASGSVKAEGTTSPTEISPLSYYKELHQVAV